MSLFRECQHYYRTNQGETNDTQRVRACDKHTHIHTHVTYIRTQSHTYRHTQTTHA